jgi:hypothetical protein
VSKLTDLLDQWQEELAAHAAADHRLSTLVAELTETTA